MLITTDRQSAFDRVLATIPFKGQVLNQTGAWWFEQTKDIITNHLLEVPHPNISIVTKCKPFPIEFVVRGFMTGTSSTSIWTQYHGGIREYCGVCLPEGMLKNEKFKSPIITPTTKEDSHDRPISPQRLLMVSGCQKNTGHMLLSVLCNFKRGQKIADQNGLILVDTKYEMGLSDEGEIVLIDEIHTLIHRGIGLRKVISQSSKMV